MIKQILHHILGGISQIIVSQASFVIGWEWKDKDFFGIDVTPNNMSWSTTIEDTGDGTSWARSVPIVGTGDLPEPTICINAQEENDTGLARFCNIRFTDDSGKADDVVRQIMQEVNPI